MKPIRFGSSLLLALLLFVVPQLVHAQSSAPLALPGGCGTANYTNGIAYLTVDSTGRLCDSSLVNAFPTSQTTGTPISVTTGGNSGTLPAGSVVVASNVGATNGAYCKLGASASTSDQLIPPNSWFAFGVGAATQLTCITSSSTTTVNLVGGSGIPAGSGGGGSSGGGGGTVTQGNAGTNAQAWWTQIGDTARGPVAVKAASTAPVATDLSLVTSLSPNSAGIITTGTVTAPSSQYVAVNGGGQTASPIAVIPTGANYETVAASQTAQVMGPTGAIGDYLSHCVIYPTSTSPGVLTVFDSTSSTTNNVITFPGGASSLSNLAPVVIPVGAISIVGAWKVTTGANMLAICYGKFT